MTDERRAPTRSDGDQVGSREEDWDEADTPTEEADEESSTDSEPADPFSVLQVARDATAEEVRRAYFRLVRLHPPETHPGEFKQIRAAYEALRSPMRRAELALESFDESVADVDLDLLATLTGGPGARDLDVTALLLVVELSVSDLTRTDFPEDLTPIDEASLELLAPMSRPESEDQNAGTRVSA